MNYAANSVRQSRMKSTLLHYLFFVALSSVIFALRDAVVINSIPGFQITVSDTIGFSIIVFLIAFVAFLPLLLLLRLIDSQFGISRILLVNISVLLFTVVLGLIYWKVAIQKEDFLVFLMCFGPTGLLVFNWQILRERLKA